jgi:3-isopropylmalate/(R)-2-methylmalate dehydratase small subunit
MRGKAHVFARDRITTDDILPPGQQGADEAHLAARVLEAIDATFASRVQKGDVVVAGAEFGCGAPREQAVWALRGARIGAVVAKSFAPRFFRDALNNGFVVIECPEAVERTETGDALEVDLQDSMVRNLTKGETYKFVPYTPFAMEVLEAGGLLPYVLRQTTGGSSA